MSPLARSLLALAAAALLLARACATQCTTVKGGFDGDFSVEVGTFKLVQTDTVNDLPPSQCGLEAIQVGVWVTACDPFGFAPRVELMDDDSRVHITCAWTEGQLCPQGLTMDIQQRCDLWSPNQ